MHLNFTAPFKMKALTSKPTAVAAPLQSVTGWKQKPDVFVRFAKDQHQTLEPTKEAFRVAYQSGWEGFISYLKQGPLPAEVVNRAISLEHGIERLPLGLAAEQNRLDAVEVLLAQKACDPNQIDPSGTYLAPLEWAILERHVPLFKRLAQDPRTSKETLQNALTLLKLQLKSYRGDFEEAPTSSERETIQKDRAMGRLLQHLLKNKG